MRTSKSIFAIVLVLSCVCSQTTSAETCEYFKLHARGEYVFGFPANIANLKMLEQGIADDPRTGFFTKYGGDGFFLQVNVNGNHDLDIPDGIESEQILARYEEVKSGLDQMKAYGRQYALKYERSASFGSGAIPVLEAQYDLSDGRSDRVSHIFLAAKHGDFIEAKLTYPASKRDLSANLIDEISAALGNVFCESRPSSAVHNLVPRALEPAGVKILAPQNWVNEVELRGSGRSTHVRRTEGHNLSGGAVLRLPPSLIEAEDGDPTPWYVLYPKEDESDSPRPEVTVSLMVTEFGRARSNLIPMIHESIIEAMAKYYSQMAVCMSANLDIETLAASLCVIHNDKLKDGGSYIMYIITNSKTGTYYRFTLRSSEELWHQYFPVFAAMVNSIEVNPKY